MKVKSMKLWNSQDINIRWTQRREKTGILCWQCPEELAQCNVDWSAEGISGTFVKGLLHPSKPIL
jgi:hypothetical protein